MKYLAAVCEDDARLARELAGECSRLLSSRGVEAHVDVFASAEELRSGLGKYRLLILDIELPGENGLSLARRARAAGSKAAVIFVTGCAEYALEGYDVQPGTTSSSPWTRRASPTPSTARWHTRARRRP